MTPMYRGHMRLTKEEAIQFEQAQLDFAATGQITWEPYRYIMALRDRNLSTGSLWVLIKDKDPKWLWPASYRRRERLERKELAHKLTQVQRLLMAALAARRVERRLEEEGKIDPDFKCRVHFIPTDRRSDWGKLRYYDFNDCRAFVYYCPGLTAEGELEFGIRFSRNTVFIRAGRENFHINMMGVNLQTGVGGRKFTKGEYYNKLQEYKRIVKSLKKDGPND